MRLFWVGLILVLFFSSCQETKTDKGEIIVSVYGKNLYKTDLGDIFYEGISYNDSVKACFSPFCLPLLVSLN